MRRSKGKRALFTIVRMRRHASLFAGLVVVVALIAGIPAGIAGMIASAGTTGIRGMLGMLPPADLSLGLAMPLGADPFAQDRAVRGVLSDAFSSGGRAIPLAVDTTIETLAAVATPRSRTSAHTVAPRVAVASAPGLDEVADLVEGRWARDVDEGTLQADSAAALGVGLGDIVTVGGVDIAVVGTWRVSDIGAARWMGDERWTTGIAGATSGPLIIDPSLWRRIDAKPWMHWVVAPDIGALQAGDLAVIAEEWSEIPTTLAAAGQDSASRSGRFIASMSDPRLRLAALETAQPLALVVLAIIAALVLWQLAGFAAQARSEEYALLWSRGAASTVLAARSALETAVVAAAGAISGVGVAGGVVLAARGPDAAASAFSTGAWAACTAILVTAGAFAIRGVRAIGPSARGRRSRGRRIAGVGGLVLVAAAAVLSTAQLLAYGPVIVDELGEADVDPISIVAPGLIVAGVVLAGMLSFRLLRPFVERRAHRAPGVALAGRTAVRRAGATGASIVMIGLATGQVVLAAGYATTWSTSFSQTQSLRAGTDLRLVAVGGPMTDADVLRASAAADVGSLAPVRTMSVAVGGGQADLIGVAPAALAALAEDGGGAIDPDALAAAMSPVGGGTVLPDSATTISVDLGSSPAVPTAAWIEDAWGRLVRIGLVADADGPSSASGSVPPTDRGPWQLAALDAQAASPDAATVAVSRVTTDAGALELPSTEAVVFPGKGDQPALVRALPAQGARVAVLSRPLAERVGADVGDLVALTTSSSAPAAGLIVAAISPAVPGASGASSILVDAAAMIAVDLRSAERPDAARTLWVASSDPAVSAEDLRRTLPPAIVVRSLAAEPDRMMLAAGASALWVAAGGCCLLAVAGFAAVSASQNRERRAELLVLSALGLGSRQQSRIRAAELGLVAGWGTLWGLIAGAAAVLIVVAALARAAVPGAIPGVVTAPEVAPLACGAVMVGLALALTAVILAAARGVGRRARAGSAEDAA